MLKIKSMGAPVTKPWKLVGYSFELLPSNSSSNHCWPDRETDFLLRSMAQKASISVLVADGGVSVAALLIFLAGRLITVT